MIQLAVHRLMVLSSSPILDLIDNENNWSKIEKEPDKHISNLHQLAATKRETINRIVAAGEGMVEIVSLF